MAEGAKPAEDVEPLINHTSSLMSSLAKGDAATSGEAAAMGAVLARLTTKEEAQIAVPSEESCWSSATKVTTPALAQIGALPDQLDGFEVGNWEYICVDPTGLRLRKEPTYSRKSKALVELAIGTIVHVRQRGLREGMMWLELADGHGWGFERTNRRRMSEIRYEPCNAEPLVVAIAPDLLHGVKMQSTPHIHDGAQLVALHAGTPVAVHRRAHVTVPTGDKGAEKETVFLQIVDDVGNQGWIPEMIGAKAIVVDFTLEQLGPEGTSLWISVLPGGSLPVNLAPGYSHKPLRTLGAGDIAELAPERLHLGGMSFYRLIAGGWICETAGKAGNAAPFVWVARELHWWIYSCANRDGAVIRAMPTREKKHNTDRKLKQGQEVVCSERVTYPDGDAFIRLEPPFSGWVPLGRKNGDIKMHPEREVPAGAGPAEGIQSAPSTTSSSRFGFGMLKSLTSRMPTRNAHRTKQTATETE